MKSILTTAAVLFPLLLAASPARANVSKVALTVGQLATPASCFVQVDVQTAEQNLFNGQEKLKYDAAEIASFQPLKTAGKTIAAGQSVLFASPAFTTETGFAADVSLTDAACTAIRGGSTVSFDGSFGPEAGTVSLPADFGALDVVGLALLIQLENQAYKVKSLAGEKEIGKAGATSSSSGGSSGTSGAPGSTGPTGNASPAPSSSSSDSSCTFASARGSSGSSAFVGLAIAAGAACRRRRSRR